MKNQEKTEDIVHDLAPHLVIMFNEAYQRLRGELGRSLRPWDFFRL
jgi:hypothetical protein